MLTAFEALEEREDLTSNTSIELSELTKPFINQYLEQLRTNEL